MMSATETIKAGTEAIERYINWGVQLELALSAIDQQLTKLGAGINYFGPDWAVLATNGSTSVEYFNTFGEAMSRALELIAVHRINAAETNDEKDE